MAKRKRVKTESSLRRKPKMSTRGEAMSEMRGQVAAERKRKKKGKKK
jgi:hypothetical protein